MQKQLFNYNIIKVLGEGGMSRVYLGEDPITHQNVAIKELLPNLAHSKDLRERFRREAQIMAKLDHPNIVKLIRYEETATSFYLIMEYVDGMDLEQHIKEVTGPISEPKAIEIMSTLLDAFGYAHEKGVVHRDIKPANFIITRDGKIKVLDFGIAKIVDENASGRTQTGTRIGTVAYMSPEQVNAAPDIDLRTDIYSLGVMLHQMITGKAAYDTTTSSDFEVQTLIVKEPLPRASSIYPYASDHLQTLIDKATQKKRENRFQDCDQFKLALFKKNQNPLPPPTKNENPNNWVPLFIFLVIIVCVIIFIANYKKSNSDNYPAVEMMDTTAVAVDTAVVEIDTAAIAGETTAVVTPEISEKEHIISTPRMIKKEEKEREPIEAIPPKESVYWPSIDKKTVSYINIVKIIRTHSTTTVFFKYTSPPKYSNGGWVCAGGDFFIRDCSTRLKYKLIKANNIPICPDKYDFEYNGQVLEFNLVFEKIPSLSNKIDIIEEENNDATFNFYGVNL